MLTSKTVSPQQITKDKCIIQANMQGHIVEIEHVTGRLWNIGTEVKENSSIFHYLRPLDGKSEGSEDGSYPDPDYYMMEVTHGDDGEGIIEEAVLSIREPGLDRPGILYVCRATHSNAAKYSRNESYGQALLYEAEDAKEAKEWGGKELQKTWLTYETSNITNTLRQLEEMSDQVFKELPDNYKTILESISNINRRICNHK